MAWSFDDSDIEVGYWTMDIPTVILPYQFEPLAIVNTLCEAEHSNTQCKAEHFFFSNYVFSGFLCSADCCLSLFAPNKILYYFSTRLINK